MPIARHRVGKCRRISRQDLTKVSSQSQREEIPVVYADSQQMIAVAEALDHPLESRPVSGLKVIFRVPGEALAKCFGLPFQVTAQSVLLRLDLIPGRGQ